MATTQTATIVGGVGAIPDTEQFVGFFTIASDTTDASGDMTLDLTDHFDYVTGIVELGRTASTGYVLEWEIPGPTVALTSTNVVCTVFEAGADSAPLDLVGTTDMSTHLAGLTVMVFGKQAI